MTCNIWGTISLVSSNLYVAYDPLSSIGTMIDGKWQIYIIDDPLSSTSKMIDNKWQIFIKYKYKWQMVSDRHSSSTNTNDRWQVTDIHQVQVQITGIYNRYRLIYIL